MNERALGIYLFVALIVLFLVHVFVVSRVGKRSVKRAALAFFVPPLAPFYVWEAGEGHFAVVWGVALLAYVVGVALA